MKRFGSGRLGVLTICVVAIYRIYVAALYQLRGYYADAFGHDTVRDIGCKAERAEY